MAAILIIEDEAVLALQLGAALESGGHHTRIAATAASGMQMAREELPDFVLLDLRLPDRSGLELIDELRALDPTLLVVLMSAYGTERDAVEAVRRGAAAYLNKPLDLGELGLKISQLLEEKQRSLELSYWRERERRQSETLIGADPRLATLVGDLERLCDRGLPAGRRPPLVLSGETGSGRRAAARALHGRISSGPFIEVRCEGAAPEELAARVFGSESGSTASAGLIDAARGGSLFFGELASLDDGMQARLLELLETRQARRAGSTRPRECDVHVLAATSFDLDDLGKRGDFDTALLDRFRGLGFEVPPLRERPEEAIQIAASLAEACGQETRGRPSTLGDDARSLVEQYDWPGNLQELRGAVERAVLLSEGTELGASLFVGVCDPASRVAPGRVLLPENGVRLADVERDLLRQALDRTGGNQTRASALLGLSRDTLRYRVTKWNLEEETI